MAAIAIHAFGVPLFQLKIKRALKSKKHKTFVRNWMLHQPSKKIKTLFFQNDI